MKQLAIFRSAIFLMKYQHHFLKVFPSTPDIEACTCFVAYNFKKVMTIVCVVA